MADHRVVVSLEASGVAATQANAVFTEFTLRQRLVRTGTVLAIAIGLAAMLIPVPIIHLLGIPIVLLTGIVLAVRQLSMTGRLRPIRIPCPKCGAMNRIGRMLGVRSADPVAVNCDSCRRILTRRITILD